MVPTSVLMLFSAVARCNPRFKVKEMDLYVHLMLDICGAGLMER